MKHKHSPNFIENEYEARNAKNNRATTFFWTVVTISLFLLGFSLTSCEGLTNKDYQTDNFELRQLIAKDTFSTRSHAYLFLVFGSYSSGTNKDYYVKMYAKIDGYYKYVQHDISRVRIMIDNSISKPHIFYRYTHTERVSNERITEQYDGVLGTRTCFIVCPEIYLPEKLLPITLK